MLINGKIEGNIETPNLQIKGNVKQNELVLKGSIKQYGIVNDYNKLINQPSINDVVLIGNKTSEELKLQGNMDEITAQEIDTIIYG